MALVNPQIAMSYRPTTEYQPRNALAEYAQVQQIVGGQRQAEVAEMQMEDLRRKERTISQIQAAAAKNGGPTNRREIARAYINSGVLEFMQLGLTMDKDLDELDAFNAAEQRFGYAPTATGATAPSVAAAAAGAAAPSAPAAAAPAGELVAAPVAAQAAQPSAAAPVTAAARQRSGPAKEIFDEYGEEAARFYEEKGYFAPSMFTPLAAQRREDPEVTARMAVFDDSIKKIREAEAASSARFRAAAGLPPLAAAAPAGATNALAPAAAAPGTNAMVAPAAQPATPPAGVQLASAGTAPGGAALTGLGGKTLAQLQNEFRTYSRLDQQRVPGAKGRLEEIKREIDFIYKTNEPGAEQNMMRALGIPFTEAGFAKFQRLKDSPSELTKLLDKLDLTPTQRRDFEMQMARKLVSHPPSAPVDVRVNAFVPASETAQAEYMKGARTTFEALRNAQPTLDNIEKAKALVPGAQGFMGTGGEPLLAAASFLNNRLGTSINTTGVTDAQELRSRLFFGILDNLKKLDSQPSQQQQNALQQALGSIGTDPTALPRVLDAFADSIRTKVNLYNQDVTSAEERGVKFPYRPQIQLKPPSSPGAAAAQIPAGAPAAAAGNTVTLPNGTVMTFPNAEAAAKFKRDARLP